MKPSSLFCLAGAALASPVAIPGGEFEWRDLAPIPSVRQEHITVSVFPSSFAILGGIVPSNNTWATTDILQFYSIPNNTWRTAAPLPVPLNHPNAAAVGDKIYLLGGLLVASDGAWRATSESWVYDIKTNVWTVIPPMPASEARGSAVVGAYNGTIFLAGGMTVLEPFQGGQQGTVSVVSAYDTTAGKWITLPPAAGAIPAPRDHAGGAVVGNTLYVLGGRDHGQVNVRDTVFALDLTNLEKGWVTKEGRMPTPRGGVAAAVVGRQVFTFGGEGNPAEGSQGVYNETEVYDTVKDEWTKLGAMKLPRHGTSAVGIGGKVYIPGGGVVMGAGPVDTLDVFEPARRC